MHGIVSETFDISIQLTALLWLVFCRCCEKNCTQHCNVIYFQTTYILSSNFMSVIFSQPARTGGSLKNKPNVGRDAGNVLVDDS